MPENTTGVFFSTKKKGIFFEPFCFDAPIDLPVSITHYVVPSTLVSYFDISALTINPNILPPRENLIFQLRKVT